MSAQSNLSIRSARREFALRFEESIATFKGVCEIARLNQDEKMSSMLARLLNP